MTENKLFTFFTIRYRMSLLAALALVICVGRPARADDRNPFPEFKAALTQALTAKGLDPDHQAYRFAVLLDNADTSGPAARGMLDVYQGLLQQYFAAQGTQTDTVSFAPFQVRVLDEDAQGKNRVVWNQAYSMDAAKTLSTLGSGTPIAEDGMPRGHDIEHALLHAAQSVTDPQGTIYIVLADKPNSDSPVTTGKQADYLAAASADGFDKPAAAGKIACTTDADTPGAPADALWYRICIPPDLQPSGALAAGMTRAQATVAASVPPETAPLPTAPEPRQSAPPIKHPAPSFPAGLIAGIVAMIIAAVIVGSFLALRRPRTAVINGNPQTVVAGKPLYLVDDNGTVTIVEKGGDGKFASLTRSALGDVVLQAEPSYEMRGRQAVLTQTNKTFTLRHTQNQDHYYEVTARLAKS